jgi:hypothetical protein
MKMLRRFLLPALILTLTLPLSAAASAKGGPSKPHPDGMTCAAFGFGDYALAETDGFTVEAADHLICIDWTTTAARSWTMAISGPALADHRFKQVYVEVKDSVPGDWCWHGAGLTPTASSLMSPVIPLSTSDACGTEYTDLGTGNDQLVLLITPNNTTRKAVTVTVAPIP